MSVLEVIQAIKNVYDPEIPVDICELGLIYGVEISSDKNVWVLMTLTTPNCPAAETIPSMVDKEIRSLKWVNDVSVEITFDPPYDIKMLSESARFDLGFDI